VAIYQLKQSGKLMSNENGYFSIAEGVYEELYWQRKKTDKGEK